MGVSDRSSTDGGGACFQRKVSGSSSPPLSYFLLWDPMGNAWQNTAEMR